MRQGFRVFDSGAHLGRARHSGRTATVDGMLSATDAAGVDRTLLIPFPVVEDFRREHDEVGAALRSHPDRIAGAACLNPFIREWEFRTEVRRRREAYGFCTLKFQPQRQGLNPLAERSDFLFETALENGLVLLCHRGAGAPFRGSVDRIGSRRRRRVCPGIDRRCICVLEHLDRVVFPNAARRA